MRAAGARWRPQGLASGRLLAGSRSQPSGGHLGCWQRSTDGGACACGAAAGMAATRPAPRRAAGAGPPAVIDGSQHLSVQKFKLSIAPLLDECRYIEGAGGAPCTHVGWHAMPCMRHACTSAAAAAGDQRQHIAPGKFPTPKCAMCQSRQPNCTQPLHARHACISATKLRHLLRTHTHHVANAIAAPEHHLINCLCLVWPRRVFVQKINAHTQVIRQLRW